jgi:hypothetical protein
VLRPALGRGLAGEGCGERAARQVRGVVQRQHLVGQQAALLRRQPGEGGAQAGHGAHEVGVVQRLHGAVHAATKAGSAASVSRASASRPVSASPSTGAGSECSNCIASFTSECDCDAS